MPNISLTPSFTMLHYLVAGFVIQYPILTHSPQLSTQVTIKRWKIFFILLPQFLIRMMSIILQVEKFLSSVQCEFMSG